jgi:hypothetical protein
MPLDRVNSSLINSKWVSPVLSSKLEEGMDAVVKDFAGLESLAGSFD